MGLIRRFINALFTRWQPSSCPCHVSLDLMQRVSHDLRTDLNGIIGYSEFLELGEAQSMTNFTAKIIHESGMSVARTSAAYFDFQHLSQGVFRPFYSRFALSDLVQELVSQHRLKAMERDVNLTFVCLDGTRDVDVTSDFERMRQVIDALVFNAVANARQWQMVRVVLAADDSSQGVVLMIEGFGASEDATGNALFDEFWNQEGYRFRLEAGPSVELALAKALIGLLKGAAKFQVDDDGSTRLVVRFVL